MSAVYSADPMPSLRLAAIYHTAAVRARSATSNTAAARVHSAVLVVLPITRFLSDAQCTVSCHCFTAANVTVGLPLCTAQLTVNSYSLLYASTVASFLS